MNLCAYWGSVTHREYSSLLTVFACFGFQLGNLERVEFTDDCMHALDCSLGTFREYNSLMTVIPAGDTHRVQLIDVHKCMLETWSH